MERTTLNALSGRRASPMARWSMANDTRAEDALFGRPDNKCKSHARLGKESHPHLTPACCTNKTAVGSREPNGLGEKNTEQSQNSTVAAEKISIPLAHWE
jgi:hypothetical protein